MVFDCSSSDIKFLQVSRTFLNILTVLTYAVVWLFSTRPLISKSPCPFNNPLLTVPKETITIGIIVNVIFHRIFQFSSNVQVLIPLFTLFQFYTVVSRDSKVNNFAMSLFCWLFLGLVFWPRLGDPFVCQSSIGVCMWFSRSDPGKCTDHLFARSNLIFLYNSQWITLPTQFCVVLYTFCANFLHSLITRLIVSSLSPHNQHLLFCCV